MFVAAVGHLFGPNEDRGLYKSIDGGKTWKKAKYIDADTGFTDVAIDPVNPKIVYAASYQRRRTWWGFNGGGAGSGLWKSTDAGKNWTKLTGGGLPAPPDGIIGRIGIVDPSREAVDDLRDRGGRRRGRASRSASATTAARRNRGDAMLRRRGLAQRREREAACGGRTTPARRGRSCRT